MRTDIGDCQASRGANSARYAGVVRAEMLGVPANRVFETLQVYLGSADVNDFNYLGRTYRVTAQADAPFRDEIHDIVSRVEPSRFARCRACPSLTKTT
jgi:hypothetical protein